MMNKSMPLALSLVSSMPDSSMRAVFNSVFAKTIILGDHKTGRSELLKNLDIYRDINTPSSIANNRVNRPFNIVIDESNFFSTIELSPQEIEHPTITALLKIWEYTQHLSKKDEQLAFRGALFTIITFDITRIDTYHAVFEKWIPLKEQLSPDSFLYIVGTHLDAFPYRTVELSEVCKQCAKKDAVYVEVSNTTSTNFSLLRKLLSKRIHYMLQQKEHLASPAFQAKLKAANIPMTAITSSSAAAVADTSLAADSSSNNEAASSSLPSSMSPIIAPHEVGSLSIPALEPSILSHSIGSIYATFFDLPTWSFDTTTGGNGGGGGGGAGGMSSYEQQEMNLMKISEKIDNFVEKLVQQTTTVADTASSQNTAAVAREGGKKAGVGGSGGIDLQSLSSPFDDQAVQQQQQSAAALAASSTTMTAHMQRMLNSSSSDPDGEDVDDDDDNDREEIRDAASYQQDLLASYQQLNDAFSILGLTLPAALQEEQYHYQQQQQQLLQQQQQQQQQQQPTLHSQDEIAGSNDDPFALPATSVSRPNLRKMMVKLPVHHHHHSLHNHHHHSPHHNHPHSLHQPATATTTTTAEMVLDLDSNMEQQIELFLLSNSLQYDTEARKKLMQVTTQVQREYYEQLEVKKMEQMQQMQAQQQLMSPGGYAYQH